MKKLHDAVVENATQSLDSSQIGSRWIRALALAIVVAAVLALTMSSGFADQIARDAISPVIPWVLIAGTISSTVLLRARLRALLPNPVDRARVVVES